VIAVAGNTVGLIITELLLSHPVVVFFTNRWPPYVAGAEGKFCIKIGLAGKPVNETSGIPAEFAGANQSILYSLGVPVVPE